LIMSVPGEGYSRNAPYTLYHISMFLVYCIYKVIALACIL